MRLGVATPPAWVDAVLARFDEFLLDHASCERKAAATARKLAARHPERPALARAMTELAREEIDHFDRVCRWLGERGLVLGRDRRDPYVAGLWRGIPAGREPYLLDRLLVSGVVEARACERLGLVAAALPPGSLRGFYRELTRAEARHHGLFVRLAKDCFDPGLVEGRLAALLDHEARVVAELPIRAAVH